MVILKDSLAEFAKGLVHHLLLGIVTHTPRSEDPRAQVSGETCKDGGISSCGACMGRQTPDGFPVSHCSGT